jgi:Flp pilus assembly protein TadG
LKESLRHIGKLCGAEAGSTAVSFALALPVLFGAIGVAADYGIMNSKHSKLQFAADQAAIAAVKELTIANTTTQSVEAAANSFAKEQLAKTDSNISVKVVIGDDKDTATVTVSETWTPFFAHFLDAKATPIVVSATAKVAGKTGLCVLALNPTAMKGVHMDKLAKLQATGCAVYSNSSHNQSIRLDQESSMKAALVCAVGGVKAKTTAVQPAAVSDCPKIEDPLASRVAPKVTGCLASNLTIAEDTITLKPGRYCGGLTVRKNAKVTFEPGDYVIADGAFQLTGGASITGENVAFYLEGEAATINFNSNTTVSLTGAKSGPMAGLLFFEDRGTTIGRIHRINSANAHTLTGTIYLANGSLRIDPNASVAQNSAYTAIIANTIQISEGPTLVLNNNYSDTNVPLPAGIRMQAQAVLIK